MMKKTSKETIEEKEKDPKRYLLIKTKTRSKLKSKHLVINPDLGPTFKCAPGHKSMEDCSLMKKCSLKHGVADSEMFNIRICVIL